MKQLKAWLGATLALVLVSACSSTADHQQKYAQLYKETPKKLMIVVHGGEAVPAELIQAFNKEVPDIVAEHGFEIIDAQQRQLTEIPALTDVDAVLYVDVQRWNQDYLAVIAAESVLELEFKLVSTKSDQELWSHQDKYTKTHLFLGGDALSELIHRAFFEASTAYENRANVVTKQAFSDFPDVLAANR
ncbi:GNA1162 family protein [Rheinheimera mangrovi]|uniref:GNA1162 family protein n=1 Tax=Rheinheimera mangrovi TaxID=2498451 RepID=UPI000F8E7E1B|nr:GNA1162 family protein [Rheinheimera mangrovi]